MKLNLIKLTQDQLLLCGAHFGQPHKFLHRQIKPYLLGFKSKFSILNIKYTQFQLKLLLQIIVNTISLRQKLLIVNHYKEMGSFLPLLKLKRCFLTEGLWVGGFLTNYKRIRLYANYTAKKQTQLYTMTTMPSIVVFLNVTGDNWGFKECLNLNIPTAIITGSIFPLVSKTLYPVVANNQTQNILIFYTNLISNAVKKGLIKEKLNVFNLRTK